MAVITGPRHSSIWDRLGTGLGAGFQKGVSDQLKALAKQKMQSLQNQQQQPQQIEQQPQLQQQQAPSAKDLSSFKRMRMQLIKKANNPKTKKKLMDQLTKMGLGEAEIGVLMGTELTEDIAQFFLDNADGDKNAARKLAKAFGYEV